MREKAFISNSARERERAKKDDHDGMHMAAAATNEHDEGRPWKKLKTRQQNCE